MQGSGMGEGGGGAPGRVARRGALCELRVDGMWHADGARVGDAQQCVLRVYGGGGREQGTRAGTRKRHSVCVCYGSTGVLRGYGDEARHTCEDVRTTGHRRAGSHAQPPCVVLTGYEDAAHEHGTRAGRASDASGVPRSDHTQSRVVHASRTRAMFVCRVSVVARQHTKQVPTRPA
eukprot:654310-Prymnesium_polylepis.1